MMHSDEKGINMNNPNDILKEIRRLVDEILRNGSNNPTDSLDLAGLVEILDTWLRFGNRSLPEDWKSTWNFKENN